MEDGPVSAAGEGSPPHHEAFISRRVQSGFVATVGQRSWTWKDLGLAVLMLAPSAFILAVFIVYLPSSKHLHIVTSFFNVYFRKLAPRGQLPSMDLEREDQTFGARTIADLTWKGLLDGLTCTVFCVKVL